MILLFALLLLAVPARASILPGTSPQCAVRLAELAEATYLPAAKLDAVLSRRGYTRLQVVDRTRAERTGAMARTTFLFTARATGQESGLPAGSVVLAIRGSHSANDWYTNVHTRQVSWTGQGRLHEGFLAVAQVALSSPAVMAQVRAAKQVYLVGHSLGGAAAVIVAAHLIEQGVPAAALHVFTYGAPRPGDATFASHYAPLLDLYEYRNSKDPFFVLPPGRYRHLSDERPDRFIALTRGNRSIHDHLTNVSDHHPWAYVYRMHGEDRDILCARFGLKPDDVRLPFALPQALAPALKRMFE